MKTNIRYNLDNMQLNDVYSLMLFLMYKMQDLPDRAVLSKLCYLLDGRGIQRLLAYFAGQTVTFPTEAELQEMTSAMLLYKFINVDHMSFVDAYEALPEELTAKQKERVKETYLSIIPLIDNYDFSRTEKLNGK